MDELLTRDEFRRNVFNRDGHCCIVCKLPAVDAHHIIERRLFPDGGYYLDNGASVCQKHHLEAEATTLSCDFIREKSGITSIILPPHLYRDQQYDKWGNPVLPNGNRLIGELFYDQSVQKILKPVIHLFVNRVKYPRNYHLPWSPGGTSDDRIMDSVSQFENEQVIVTVKMDGECTTMYTDYIHARSLDYDPHPSRSRVRAFHASFAHDIPNGWRICGENLWAKHSIHYKNLPHFFMAFSIWNEHNICLSWDETKQWAALLGISTVPELYCGQWDETVIRSLHKPTYNDNPCEGYVVRVAREFPYSKFRDLVGKYVRESHVTTHGHWIRQRIEENEIEQ